MKLHVFLAFYDTFRNFLDFTQKLPGGVEGPPGDSYFQDPKLGFLHAPPGGKVLPAR